MEAETEFLASKVTQQKVRTGSGSAKNECGSTAQRRKLLDCISTILGFNVILDYSVILRRKLLDCICAILEYNAILEYSVILEFSILYSSIAATSG